MNKMINWFHETIEKNKTRIPHSELKKLTIVILSLNRQNFLVRQIAYWANSSVNVLIVDGTSESLENIFLNKLADIPNIKYIHSPTDVMVRFNLACSMLNTEYVMLHGDDELYLEDGLLKMVSFLNNNNDYVACTGQVLGFYLDPFTKNINYFLPYGFLKQELNQNSAPERYSSAINNFSVLTVYAISRKDIWINSWTNINKPTSSYCYELGNFINTLSSGKVKILDCFYWLKSWENEPVSTPNEDRKLTFHTWWTDQKFENEKKEYLNLLSAYSAKINLYPQEKARNEIEQALNYYDQKFMKSPETSSSPKTIHITSKNMLKKILPLPLLALTSNLNKLRLFKSNGTIGSIRNFVFLTFTAPIFKKYCDKKCKKELLEVNRMLLDFHQSLLK